MQYINIGRAKDKNNGNIVRPFFFLEFSDL